MTPNWHMGKGVAVGPFEVADDHGIASDEKSDPGRAAFHRNDFRYSANVATLQLLNGTDLFSNNITVATNGTPNASYTVLASTNVALPVASWVSIATNQFKRQRRLHLHLHQRHHARLPATVLPATVLPATVLPATVLPASDAVKSNFPSITQTP